MPELPEVETVRRTLKNFILHKTIQSVEIYYEKIIEDDPQQFIDTLTHQCINDIQRYGKYLIFILDDCAFVSHLRMEGKYHIVPHKQKMNKHTHVVFQLDDGTSLQYQDTRKFGRMKLVDKTDYLSQPPFNKLGKEPFDITVSELYHLFHHSSLPIKTALLKQEWICGIGNIYANEICFRLGIDPRTRCSALSKRRVQQLINIAIEVLNEAIEQGGTTIHSFDANGIHGLFQVSLNVHMQKKCSICGSDIKKIMLNQRGTYYCPHCQKRRY